MSSEQARRRRAGVDTRTNRGYHSVMKCKWCDAEAARKQGRVWLCQKHYRFQQMRVRAKSSKKTVPSYELLEILYRSLIDNRCPCCAMKMNLLGRDGMKNVLTLQHDRGGGMRLICLSCNTRHQHYDGDSFYSRNPDVHPCRDCGRVLQKSEFWPDRSRPLGIKPYCKGCSNARLKKWADKNRPKLRAKSREYRRRASCG